MKAPVGYEIVPAHDRHLGALAEIELAAAQLLRGHAPARVLRETTSVSTLRHAARDGRVWVALSDDTPVGFALIELLADGAPHLEEIDVHPAHGRRGVGTALVNAARQWASLNGHQRLTLTTFRAPPFNMRFYERLGFAPLSNEALPPELSSIVACEASRGLSTDMRVVMQYNSSPLIRRATPEDRERMFDIWLRSARATHTFITEHEVQSLMTPVREYLSADGTDLWVLCASTGLAIGFMGLDGARIDSLFLAPECLRRGFGRRCVAHARRMGSGLTVTVNEQNHDAVAFYTACGFTIEGRSDRDEDGRPFPILLMRAGDASDECSHSHRPGAERAAIMSVRIRPAVASEHAALEAVQRRASLNNPGDREAILANPDAIELPPAQIDAGHVFVADGDDGIAGFAALVPRGRLEMDLDALFVEPHLWRQGVGRLLIDYCVEFMRRQDMTALHVIGNPHAEKFYRACGFEMVGTVATRFGDGLLFRRPL